MSPSTEVTLWRIAPRLFVAFLFLLTAVLCVVAFNLDGQSALTQHLYYLVLTKRILCGLGSLGSLTLAGLVAAFIRQSL
jgi:hypothetical protein